MSTRTEWKRELTATPACCRAEAAAWSPGSNVRLQGRTGGLGVVFTPLMAVLLRPPSLAADTLISLSLQAAVYM